MVKRGGTWRLLWGEGSRVAEAGGSILPARGLVNRMWSISLSYIRTAVRIDKMEWRCVVLTRC